METRADRIRAYLYAVGLHAMLAVLLVAGVSWTKSSRSEVAAGPIVEATLVTAAQLAEMRRPPQARPKPPEPKPEPPKPEPAKPESAPLAPNPPKGEDRKNQEKIDRLAQEKARAAEQEQEQKIKKEQQALDQEERLTQMQREKLKQLEDIRRLRETAEKKRKLEQEKLAQLEDMAKKPSVPAPPEPPKPEAAAPGAEGTDTSLLARYQAAIQSVVQQNWLRPDNAEQGLNCKLVITQIPGGDVIEARVLMPCNADDLTRRSIEAAVLRAQPLPYQGYEKVFSRSITFTFRYDG